MLKKREKKVMVDEKYFWGLDGLRIIAMLMIIAIHYFNQGGIITSEYTSNINSVISRIIYAACMVSVNCYVLISGYFYDITIFKWEKVIQIWLKTIFYSISILILIYFCGLIPITKKHILRSILPFTTKHYWFINTWVALYLISPYLNKLIKAIEKKEFKLLLIIVIALFSIPQTFLPLEYTLDETAGYSLVWFCVLYFVSAYFKRYNILWEKRISLGLFLLNSLFIALVGIVIWTAGVQASISQYWGVFYKYDSIFVLAASVGLFQFCLNCTIRFRLTKHFIKIMSPATLGVYLFHVQQLLHRILWTDILNTGSYYRSPYMIIHFVACVIAVYLICSIIEVIRAMIFDKLNYTISILIVKQITIKNKKLNKSLHG